MATIPLLLLLTASQASLPPVLPKPVSMTAGVGAPFEITRETKIAGGGNLEAKKIFQSLLSSSAGFQLPEANVIGKSKAIEFVHASAGEIAREGYTLHADANGIKIRYSTPAGALYAVETLRQLLPAQIESQKTVTGVAWTVPAVDIKDEPRFGWRGLMLDVSRHFFPVSFIKRYLDYLAMEKMNVFHWHLVDDGGWRIQIDHYPKLTSIGGTRYGITTGWDQSKLRFDSTSGLEAYTGFYTKSDVKELVKYAADRNITIVPEIEMPGHSMAVFAAYPELSCLNVPPSGLEGHPGTDVYCAGNEETYKFLQTVLTEVMELFPSKFIHVGGDEVDKGYWHGCTRCQSLMKAKGLKNEEELQSYFIQRMERFVASKGRRLIGWDEILEGGLAPGATVMSWRGEDGGIAAAKAGHDVVMSPTTYCYFDFAYLGQSTEHVYSYEPIPAALNAEQAKHVLGGQANEWTEWIPTVARAEFMIFPRVAALSEDLWTPKELKDYADFAKRLPSLYQRLDLMGTAYHMDAPNVQDTALVFTDHATVSAEGVSGGPGTLRYTTDGSTPGTDSPTYTAPIDITTDADVHFAYVSGGGQPGEIATVSCRKAQPVDVSNTSAGWHVDYFEGEWNAVPDFSKLTPAKSSEVSAVSIDPRGRDEDYALHYTGYFHATEDGVYAFTLTSDDGSWLKVGGAMAVSNDGPHAAEPKTGHIRLPAGWHKIEVGYYQGSGAEALKLEVKVPSATGFKATDDLVVHAK